MPRTGEKRKRENDNSDDSSPSKRVRLSRSEQDECFREVGRAVRERLDPEQAAPTWTRSRPPRVLDVLLNPAGDALLPDKTFNRRYRAAWKAQDELLSTASTREFLVGVFEGIDGNPLSDESRDTLGEMTDLLSTLRLPTEFSGYATADSVMQHPANRQAAMFDDPYRTAAKHSELDVERRDYILRALDRALEAGEGSWEIVQAGARAAIEFSLNYFTAPITAQDVKPFSRAATTADDDATVQEQLAVRENLKRLYHELGGTLRPRERKETSKEALSRRWGGTAAQGYPERPPSPFRDAGDADDAIVQSPGESTPFSFDSYIGMDEEDYAGAFEWTYGRPPPQWEDVLPDWYESPFRMDEESSASFVGWGSLEPGTGELVTSTTTWGSTTSDLFMSSDADVDTPMVNVGDLDVSDWTPRESLSLDFEFL